MQLDDMLSHDGHAYLQHESVSWKLLGNHLIETQIIVSRPSKSAELKRKLHVALLYMYATQIVSWSIEPVQVRQAQYGDCPCVMRAQHGQSPEKEVLTTHQALERLANQRAEILVQLGQRDEHFLALSGQIDSDAHQLPQLLVVL